MDDAERIDKINKEAANLVREGLTQEFLIHRLYHNDLALSHDLEPEDRASRRIVNQVYETALTLYEKPINAPRETRIYKGLEQTYKKVQKPKEQHEEKRKPPERRRRP